MLQTVVPLQVQKMRKVCKKNVALNSAKKMPFRENPIYNQVLVGHIIPGSWYTAGLVDGDKLKNWNGHLVSVEKNQNGDIK